MVLISNFQYNCHALLTSQVERIRLEAKKEKPKKTAAVSSDLAILHLYA